MPSRMASASLACFLQPANRDKSPTTIRKCAARFMRLSNCLPIAHTEHHNNVDDGQDREGITERAVNDVPEVEDLLRARQEQDALGERGLLPSGLNRVLEFDVLGGEKSAQRGQPRTEATRPQAEPGNLEGPSQI